jgi:hypothetical protein
MMETLLLLLLALGGGNASPAASPGLAPAPGVATPVTGVWRGKWIAAGDGAPVPVEAVLAPGRDSGTLIALIVSGFGRERRMARLAGRYDNAGVSLALPSGGALRLIAESGTRLIGDVKIGGATGFLPGDGAVELIRVRR